MKRLKSYYMHIRHHQSMERKWIFPLAIGSLVSLFLVLLTSLSSSSSDGTPLIPLYRSFSSFSSRFVETKLHPIPINTLPPPPRLAYLISGSAGDGNMLKRTLQALYHPNNRYVVHLDRESSAEERLDLSNYVQQDPVFLKFGNVKMIQKANLVTYRGPTMVANTLHAAAILLRDGGDWDWFINLSASDYPLVTQDDLLHTFSYLPRDLNFIDHTSNIGWKEFQRAKPIIVDPGLYMTKKADVFWVTQRRSVPTAFKLFTGSAWMALSRPFVDYTIWGWDNLPRVVLMYYANFISSPEGYFHTVICNAQEFRNTTVNSDLHFISWDNPPKQHPHHLNIADMQRMIDSNAPFARKFPRNDPVLDKIDSELLSRGPSMFTPGAWCIGSRENGSDPCSVIGNTTVLRPGPGAKRLENLISNLLSSENFRPKQCK
ncbi:beta-glucuronosyltransferase GlcAT14B [Ricinus communis]|uniref:Acetylglucosaminyltransferase, putative n=1 Tax=Ricinus communis TaxID=3988 RepID=B9RUK1_RICCO|nr:beta-glucuronosyltransferase GlcAT14B [Ricinus communis]EEF44988.1 acetylglucosaminyltransferase, putative [Ricinus communis]|eukprot:XP_025012796.1 beta-glucuronosyltransferase GlcAT14B [Ricinus communis]